MTPKSTNASIDWWITCKLTTSEPTSNYIPLKSRTESEWRRRGKAAWCRMDCYITGKLKFQRRPKSYWRTTRASLNFTLRFSSLDNQPIIQYFSPTCWKTEAPADGIIQKEITKHTRCTLENQTAFKPKKEFQHDVSLSGSDFQVSRGNSTMTWIIDNYRNFAINNVILQNIS